MKSLALDPRFLESAAKRFHLSISDHDKFAVAVSEYWGDSDSHRNPVDEVILKSDFRILGIRSRGLPVLNDSLECDVTLMVVDVKDPTRSNLEQNVDQPAPIIYAELTDGMSTVFIVILDRPPSLKLLVPGAKICVKKDTPFSRGLLCISGEHQYQINKGGEVAKLSEDYFSSSSIARGRQTRSREAPGASAQSFVSWEDRNRGRRQLKETEERLKDVRVSDALSPTANREPLKKRVIDVEPSFTPSGQPPTKQIEIGALQEREATRKLQRGGKRGASRVGRDGEGDQYLVQSATAFRGGGGFISGL